MKKNGLLVAKRGAFSGIAFLISLGFIFNQTRMMQAIKFQGQEMSPLERGKPLERELAGGQSHVYQLSLAAGQYLSVVTEQRGIDVVVVLFGPDGKMLVEMDSPNGAQGPEPLTWITESNGTYRIEIRSNDKDAKAGRYEVKIIELRLATEVDRILVEALSLYNKSMNLGGKGEFDKAIPLAERSLKLREQVLGSHHLDVSASLSNVAGLYYYKGDYAKAEPLYQRALAIRERALGTDHPEVAESLNDFALLYHMKGDYAKAEPLYQRALAIREHVLGPNHPDIAVSINNFAGLYYEKGNYAKAEPLFQRALTIREQSLGDHHPDVANALNNLALLFHKRGDYARAEPLYQRALAIREQGLGPHHPDVAQSLDNLAVLYREKGDYVKAEPLHQRALMILEQSLGPNHPNVTLTLNNLAVLYREKGEYAKTEPLYQRALEISEKALGPNHPYVAISLNNLASFYRDKEDYAKAELLYQRALGVFEKARGPNHPDIGSSLESLALLYRDKGEDAKAEMFHKRALDIFEKSLGSNHLNVVTVLNNLAWHYRATGDVQQAITLLKRATEAGEINLNQTLVTGSERQKLLFIRLREKETNLILSLQAEAASKDTQALNLAFTTLLRRKGRGLEATSDVIATLHRHARPQDQSLFDQLTNVHSQLAALSLRGTGRTPIDQYRTQLQQLADEADKIEADLSTRSVEFRVQTQPVTIAAIQAALPTNAALVEFATYYSYATKAQKNGPLHYVAYILSAQGEPRWVELGEAAPLERAVAAWREALRDPKRTDVKRLAREVDAKVMQPVRALLGEARHLLLSPDGVLNLIPFAALVDERQQYLTERYECSYLTSGRDLLRLQVPRPSQSAALIVADPAFGEMPQREMLASRKVDLPQTGTPNASPAFDFSQAYFQPLPGTADEARTLHALLPQATVLTQAQATKLALQEVKAPRLLHIATHGFFLRDAEIATDNARGIRLPSESVGRAQTSGPLIDPSIRSGLALAGANRHQTGTDNGILTAKEAAGLNLWGTKLVVLSACDTGVGEVKNGEGVYGLRRAFVLAGSETQVMSLWSISDQGTHELMADYYKGLRQGAGRSAALRQVQLRMLKNPSRRHPYYWASFIPSGEWANLNGQR